MCSIQGADLGGIEAPDVAIVDPSDPLDGGSTTPMLPEQARVHASVKVCSFSQFSILTTPNSYPIFRSMGVHTDQDGCHKAHLLLLDGSGRLP